MRGGAGLHQHKIATESICEMVLKKRLIVELCVGKSTTKLGMILRNAIIMHTIHEEKFWSGVRQKCPWGYANKFWMWGQARIS